MKRLQRICVRVCRLPKSLMELQKMKQSLVKKNRKINRNKQFKLNRYSCSCKVLFIF